jgi:hypothetical protein
MRGSSPRGFSSILKSAPNKTLGDTQKITPKEKIFNIDFNSTTPIYWDFLRADSIKLSFNFSNGGTGATKLRVFCTMQKGGYNFGNETEITDLSNASISFTSGQTSRFSGWGVITVQLVDVEENLINSANIIVNIIESYSQTPFEPSKDFRDDVLKALDNVKELEQLVLLYKNEAQTAKVDAQESAEQSQTSEANAQASAQEASESATSASESAEQAQESAIQASESEANAEYWAKQAQEISDPENRIGTLVSQVSTLQTGKVNSGVLHFNNGYVISDEAITPRMPMSVCCRVKLTNPNDLGIDQSYLGYGISFFTNSKYINGVGGFQFGLARVAENDFRYTIIASVDGQTNYRRVYAKTAVDNDTHELIAVLRSVNDWSLYVDGNELNLVNVKSTLDSETLPTNKYRIGSILGNGHSAGTASKQVSDVAVFNFDITAEDAPYTRNDYQQGKSIPLSLLDPTAEQRAEVALENYTFNGEVLDYSGNGRHATITGNVKGDNDTKVETLFEKISARISNQTNG